MHERHKKNALLHRQTNTLDDQRAERLSKSFEQSLKITAAAELVNTLKKKTVHVPEQERKTQAMIRAGWR